jgi:hypothetical protein
MLRWLRTFIRREVVADVPAELYRCLDCGKLNCAEGEWQDCTLRRVRAAEVAAALAAPQGSEAMHGI